MSKIYFFLLFLICFDCFAKASPICKKHFNEFKEYYQIPDGVLETISHIESKKYPWAINVQGRSYYFVNKQIAVKVVENLIEKGIRNIDIGCMQINYRVHGKNFRNIEEMFEPRNNVNYSAYFLRKNFEEFRDWQKAISAYHSRTEHLGKLYYSRFQNFFHKENEINAGKL